MKPVDLRDIPKSPKNDAPGCGPLRADLKAYLDGELAWPLRARLRWHMVRCAQCQEELAWLQRLGRNMKDLEKAVPRPELRARILANLPDAPPRPASRPAIVLEKRGFQTALPRLALGSSLAGLLLVGAFALGRYTAPPTRVREAGVPVSRDSGVQETAVRRPQPASLRPDRSVVHAPKPEIQSARDPFAALDDPSRFTDPTTRRAVALMKASENAETREEPRRSQPTTPAVEELPRQKPRPVEPMRLALAVSDPVSAQETLRLWTEMAGGSMDVTPERTASAEKAATTARPTPPTTPGTGSRPLLALHVPAERAGELLTVLEHTGTLTRLPAAKADARSRRLSSPNAMRLHTDFSAPGDGSLLPRRAGPTRSFASPKKIAEDQQERSFLTILVRLRPREK